MNLSREPRGHQLRGRSPCVLPPAIACDSIYQLSPCLARCLAHGVLCTSIFIFQIPRIQLLEATYSIFASRIAIVYDFCHRLIYHGCYAKHEGALEAFAQSRVYPQLACHAAPLFGNVTLRERCYADKRVSRWEQNVLAAVGPEAP